MDWYDDFADWSDDPSDIWDWTVGIARLNIAMIYLVMILSWINTWLYITI